MPGKPSSDEQPTGAQANPLGDPRAYRGMSTTLKKLSQPEKKSDFLPSFSSSVGSFILEVAKIVIIALIIIKPIHYFVLQPFYVRGASMEPTFYNNEYLIIDELSYHLHAPRRSDVIVLHNPRQPEEFLIKRIIGLPGERLVINDAEILVYAPPNYDQPRQLEEKTYLDKSVLTVGHIDVTLKDDEYFVLGDNRPASLDSRSFGPITRKSIVGRTALRAWPVYRFRTFPTPNSALVDPVVQ